MLRQTFACFDSILQLLGHMSHSLQRFGHIGKPLNVRYTPHINNEQHREIKKARLAEVVRLAFEENKTTNPHVMIEEVRSLLIYGFVKAGLSLVNHSKVLTLAEIQGMPQCSGSPFHRRRIRKTTDRAAWMSLRDLQT
jgi:hypothetical protein